MSDMMRDLGQAMSAHSKSERARLRDEAIPILRAHAITFTEHNGGAHLIVMGWEGTTPVLVDFWPGTQKWSVRGKEKGAGIDNLINRLKGK